MINWFLLHFVCNIRLYWLLQKMSDSVTLFRSQSQTHNHTKYCFTRYLQNGAKLPYFLTSHYYDVISCQQTSPMFLSDGQVGVGFRCLWLSSKQMCVLVIQKAEHKIPTLYLHLLQFYTSKRQSILHLAAILRHFTVQCITTQDYIQTYIPL